MNVLSLFDGMSCGQIALKELGVKVEKYYASEIDKYAIQQSSLNFPNTIHLGSVTDVDVSKLDRIDLLIGGSPCQSFSFAGKRNGMSTTDNVEIYTLEKYLKLKEQGFEFDGESYLFWEYMRILTDIRKYNPDVLFLLENVEMGKKWERILSEAVGIYGVHINSALVSAQNRKRIYWTNIRTRPEGFFGDLHSDIPQPADRGILLKDILEDNVDEKYYLSDKMLDYLNRNSELQKENGNGFKFQPFTDFEIKSKTVTNKEGNRMDDNFIVAMRGRGENNEQQLEPQSSGKTNALTSVQKDNLLIIPEATAQGYAEIAPGECFDAENINSKTRRGRKMKDKSNCLMAKETDFMRYECSLTENYIQWDGTGFDQDNRAYYEDGKSGTLDVKAGRQKVLQNQTSKLTNRIRRLTPTECARLQTIPNWYKWEFVESNYFGYICSITKKTIICKTNVSPMAVPGQFQISQLDYATCTTLDLLELEKQRVEKLTKQKNVKLKAAIDMLKQKNTETYVSCITKDFIDTEHGNFQSNNIKKNVSFVIKKLVEEELTECAPVIIEVSNYMEIHLLLKKGKTNLKYQLNQQDIMGVKIKNRDTKMLWNIKLGDLLKTEKLSTILALINWIIDRKIYIYAKDVLNIRLSIGNSNVSEQNYISVELSDLKMESIISCSDTQQYKLLGNGWTVEVIKHILKFINQ